jgi:hypothetical protein
VCKDRIDELIIGFSEKMSAIRDLIGEPAAQRAKSRSRAALLRIELRRRELKEAGEEM